MKFLAILILSVISISTFADESGYLLQGKKFVVYKDGVKQDKVPERAPSSVNEYKSAAVDFITDDTKGVTCYWFSNAGTGNALSCVKTK